MKILYFAPKEQHSFVRLLFRGHKFKGVSKIEDLIQYMCDPFLLCLFDSEYLNESYKDKFLHFRRIFGQDKIGEIIYQRHDSDIKFNDKIFHLKEFAANLCIDKEDEKRSNLRIQPSLNLDIKILSPDKNKNVKCLNISTDGICILSKKIEDRFVDIIIDNKFTAEGRICWKEKEPKLDGYYVYGLALKLDEPKKFRQYIKSELIQSRLDQLI